MKVETYRVGPMDNGVYLIIDEATQRAALVDPSFESEFILDVIRERGLTLEWILNTHGHYDHVVNNAFFKRATGAPLAIHADDVPFLEDMRGQAMWMGMEHVEDSPPPDRLLEEGDVVQVGNLYLHVRHTPGHSPGGVTFVAQTVAIVGDVLFAGGIGRTDLPGGDAETLFHSIRTQLFTLPDDTIVLPGHGPSTTIGHEKRTNPFLLHWQ
ncbi:MAG: MBL fold metallo-hydrolase [Abditibacteriales bacterium]|nr:MBL fold metallo-hydrolase [Abditibacteriales bacterium]MDW8366983.1 MBL fold metallo-hydrolase [Abditibacteriales bacterium]